MDIRRLEPADAEAYQAVRLRGLSEHPDAFTSSHEEEANRPMDWARQRLDPSSATVFWGAFEHGQLLGVVGLERSMRLQNRHKGTVVGMYVGADAARRGVGRALLHALLEHARAQGLALLVLTVTVGNPRARALYLAAGFRSFGVEPHAVRIAGAFRDKEHMFHLLENS